MSEYPQHEKLKELGDAVHTLGNFLEWLDEQRLYICAADEDHDGDQVLEPTYLPKSTIVARFFKIDEKALEEEKRTMLEALRKKTGANMVGTVE